jgi:hypothetical protein
MSAQFLAAPRTAPVSERHFVSPACAVVTCSVAERPG